MNKTYNIKVYYRDRSLLWEEFDNVTACTFLEDGLISIEQPEGRRTIFFKEVLERVEVVEQDFNQAPCDQLGLSLEG